MVASTAQSTVTLGCVKYLNTLPLVEGLASCDQLTLDYAAPANLISMLTDRRVDLALASIVDAARADVALLPVGMIGCAGPTMTVRLLSRVPFENVGTIHADTDSHTSVILAQLILRDRFNTSPSIIDYHAREMLTQCADDLPETVLLIGDKVITAGDFASLSYTHELDLGSTWHELTNMPFVYAAWMCHADDADSLPVALAAAMLDRQRRHNATRTDWIVAKRASDRHWPAHTARDYLGSCLRYDCDAAAQHAAQHFIDRAADLGLLPRATLNWLAPRTNQLVTARSAS